MSSFFSLDSPLMKFLTKLADLLILNLAFVVCSLPVFTLGASFTGMYYVTLKMIKNEEGDVLKQFWRSFKQNFKQATLIWLVMLAIALLLGFDIFYMSQMNYPTVIKVLIFVFIFIWMLVLLHAFPLLSRFDNTIKNTLKNSVIIALTHMPKTVLMILMTLAPIVFFWRNIKFFPILVMLGFSTMAYVNSIWLDKIYEEMTINYLGPQEKKKDNTEEEEFHFHFDDEEEEN